MKTPSLSDDKASQEVVELTEVEERTRPVEAVVEYRLYKRRFVGLMGIVTLNAASALAWPWFGPIANEASKELSLTLDQINWLGNGLTFVFIVAALLAPYGFKKYGIQTTCFFAALLLVLSSWIRYAGTSRSLSPRGTYALLMMGQLVAAVPQAIFQVIGPAYAEAWFDLKGRITATMVMTIANPVGGAIAQIVSPLAGDSRESVLVLGIISTIVTPAVFLIKSRPPSPPTYAGSIDPPSLSATLRACFGLEIADPESQSAVMTKQERIDFAIITALFCALVSATNAFSIESAQILQPYGYSSDTAGFMGAALLLSGLIAAAVTAPLFDRVFTGHLALCIRILSPLVGLAWLSLIWAVRPDNTAALYAIFVLVGVGSLIMLPVALELACEVTRNADGSSAILWSIGNVFAVIFVIIESALRAPSTANPPLNMKKGIMFQGICVVAVTFTAFFIKGKQVRRETDVQKKKEGESERA